MSAATGDDGALEEAPDSEWFVLTQGMDAYETFRYIARHVLDAALEEARSYADDERIFRNVDPRDVDAVEAHLASLDAALREDATLSSLERIFLCAAVSAAMHEHDLEARCYGDLIRFSQPLDERDRCPGDENGPTP